MKQEDHPFSTRCQLRASRRPRGAGVRLKQMREGHPPQSIPKPAQPVTATERRQIVAAAELEVRDFHVEYAPGAALAAGVGMVHQHFTLADNMTVLENVPSAVRL